MVFDPRDELRRLLALAAVTLAARQGFKYDPNQPRDDHGRWGEGGGGDSGSGGDSGGGSSDGGTISSNPKLNEAYAERAALHDALENDPTRFANLGDKELLERRQAFDMQRRNAAAAGRQEDVDKWQGKKDEIDLERDRRIQLASVDRRIEAMQEAEATGKLTVTQSEMQNMVANQGDAYFDAGLVSERGGHTEYNPDVFHTSDLSGARIRHYVTLPDARIAHPDELTEARRRGRVVVVENKPAPVASWVIKAEIPPTEDIDILRADLVNSIFDAFIGFLSSAGSVTKWRNDGRKALARNIPDAFYRGYQDAGGEETEDEDEAWIKSKLGEQSDFMGGAFESLKGWRDGETFTEGDVQARADVWGGMLDGVYSEGKLRGGKNMMLYFDGDDGAESCDTCQRLKDGPNRSTKYVREHGLIPYPGNPNFECGSYRCEHNWFSVKTDEQVTF